MLPCLHDQVGRHAMRRLMILHREPAGGTDSLRRCYVLGRGADRLRITSRTALFGSLQRITSEELGRNPYLSSVSNSNRRRSGQDF